MPSNDPVSADHEVRWGLAAKLFAILLLLGAIAVLVTSVMGYLRARQSLQEAIYNQLTTARKSKARQVETTRQSWGVRRKFYDLNKSLNGEHPTRRALFLDAARLSAVAIWRIDRPAC
jgi:hypothetical protein